MKIKLFMIYQKNNEKTISLNENGIFLFEKQKNKINMAQLINQFEIDLFSHNNFFQKINLF